MIEPHIAIITDEPGWHGRQLKRAFAARGRQGLYVSSTECRLDLSGPQPRVLLPGFKKPPAGVFVRGIPGGTLEQVILRLDCLHALSELGILIYNHPRAIERTVDKAMTSFLLKRAQLPTPETWVCESEPQARAIVLKECARGRKLVAKPLFGSQGTGVRLIEKVADLEDREGLQGVYYLQAFQEKLAEQWCDVRVFVIDGVAVAAMRRSSAHHWITNRARGGRCEALPLDGTLTQLAEAAARAIDIDYAGVDLMPLADGGYTITEVNSIPAWQGLQSVAGIDIAARLADHFFSRMAPVTGLQAVT
ncbi:MAG TPA: RimK family alpha-L-glutamate ligase [Gammaproteobacteria bacterium]|nr:RimK family alpha-L-glutamate ligase [Gammaproteobacteria bacterium]